MACPYSWVVEFLLRGARIVQLEIGKIRRGMTGEAIADLARRDFCCCRGWGTRRLRKKHLQAIEFKGSELKILCVELELAV